MINTPVPYQVVWQRLLIVFGSVVAIYLLFSLPIFKQSYNEKNGMHVFLLQAVTILFALLVGVYSVQGGNELEAFSKQGTDAYTGLMVDALIQGQVHLTHEPSEELKQMENPYDYSARTNKKIDYLYDFAYYNGNYYVYFSILPIITLFLPFKLLTDYYFPIALACLLYAIIGVIYTSLFTKEVLKRHFPNITVRNIILGVLFMLFSSFLLFNIALSRIYEMVSILGYALVMAGSYYFLKSQTKEKVRYGYLALACTLLAMAVSARPNLLFISLLIVPTLIRRLTEFIQKKESKEIIKLIASVAIPYAVIGMGIMIYNYLRFDSIFEFGARYQLTSNDMGKLGYRLSTVPIGMWHYLWNPFQILGTFPFIYTVDSNPLYVGFYGSGCKGARSICAKPNNVYIIPITILFKEW